LDNIIGFRIEVLSIGRRTTTTRAAMHNNYRDTFRVTTSFPENRVNIRYLYHSRLMGLSFWIKYLRKANFPVLINY
jgi:hypothetical protein